MMDKLMGMMGQEDEMMQEKGLDPEILRALQAVLDQLIQESEMAHGNMISKDLDGMQKVEVMAEDEEGLKEGLDVAEDVVDDEEEDEEDNMY